jgi:hypothetical protein
MTQELLCLTCQQTLGRYQCPTCHFWYCFAHCGDHGCSLRMTRMELPALDPQERPLRIFGSPLWASLWVALHSAGQLFLIRPGILHCIAFGFTPPMYRAGDVDITGDVPIIKDMRAESLEMLVSAMSEPTQMFLLQLLEYLATHPYNATVPPPDQYHDTVLPSTQNPSAFGKISWSSIRVKHVNLGDDTEGGDA